MSLLQEIKVPLIAVNDASLTVVDLPFKQNAFVSKGNIILVLETSKTTYDVLAETDGFINYLCKAGIDYDVNEVIAKIFSQIEDADFSSLPEMKSRDPRSKPPDESKQWQGETIFSKKAVELIESSGLSRTLFKHLDFVSRQDVELLLDVKKAENNKSAAREVLPGPVLSAKNTNSVLIETLSSYKKREVQYLSDVQSAGLTSTINTFVETAGIFIHINKSLKYLRDSLLPVIIYETARLLETYTHLNAYYTAHGIAFYREVSIGFAIDIDKGIKVLRIKEAGSSSLQQIESDIMDLSNKYIDDKLDPDDLTNISFTVTDLSAEGVAFFSPLVNSMNSAILGISAIDEKLERCTLSVTFDHRVTEGKFVSRFLKELKTRLESYRSNPASSSHSNINCFKCFKALKDDLSETGFSKCVTPEGKDAFICQACLKGF